MTGAGGRIRERVSALIPISERHDDIGVVYEQYLEALRRSAESFEFVFVVDGGFPDVVRRLQELQAGGGEITIIQLTRRFGEATALSVGFEHCRGELILTLPAYLQTNPEALPELITSLGDDDMIAGRRWPRSDSAINRFGTRVFHWVIRVVTGYTFRDLGCAVRLMRRRVAEEVLLYGDQHRFLPILASSRGFKVREKSMPQSQTEGYVRFYRPGIYLRRLLDVLAIFFIIRFTKKPLRFFGLVGSTLVAFSFAILAVVVTQRLLGGVALADRPAFLFGIVFLVLGVQLFALGLIGELIIFTHARDIKEYTIAEVVDFAQGEDEPAKAEDSDAA